MNLPAASKTSEAGLPPKKLISRGFIFLAGVLLPLAAIVIEFYTHWSQMVFIDPMPSPFHFVVLALAPAANAWLLWNLAGGKTPRLKPLAWGNGFALGVSAFYTVLYLPLMPLGVMGLVVGIGFLALSPLFCLIAGWRARALLRRQPGVAALGRRPLWGGLLLALAVLMALDAPAIATRLGVAMATAQKEGMRHAGLRWLRAVGSESLLRDWCGGRSAPSIDLLGILLQLSRSSGPEEMRQLYYRVTGQPFNTQGTPKGFSWRELRHPQDRGFNRIDDWDSDRGGVNVGGPATGVSLAASRLDGSIDAEAALSYMEWTLVLRNESSTMQEGRAQIALPPGGVVSRLTLWIDGEPQEAAFGTRRQTRGAYQKVVSRRQDPVLVTTAGKDRVLLQMFPILPRGGEMKVRLGITAPLAQQSANRGSLVLPAFRERNFAVPENFTHAVWLESKAPLLAGPLFRVEKTPAQAVAVYGEIGEAELGGAASAINVPWLALGGVWGEDAVAGSNQVVVQHWRQQAVAPPVRVALVVDGSRSVAPLAGEIAAALDQLPPSVQLGFFPATDADDVAAGPMTAIAARRLLERMPFVGGQDNLGALERAWDWAAGSAGAEESVVLWVHGPQPVLLGSAEGLLQRAERRGNRVRWQTVEAVAGPNKILSSLDGQAAIRPLLRQDGLGADLGRLFAGWRENGSVTLAVRERLASAALLPDSAVKKSDHLARLWAAQEIDRLLDTRDEKNRQQATQLAVDYHLVTPVSGAVVLENAKQYEEAGLTPVEKGSVPTVPEPEEWALIAVAVFFLIWLLRHRRTQAGPVPC